MRKMALKLLKKLNEQYVMCPRNSSDMNYVMCPRNRRVPGAVVTLFAALLIGGCATHRERVNDRFSKIRYADGINRREAVVIAQQHLMAEHVDDTYSLNPHMVMKRKLWRADYVDHHGRPTKWHSFHSNLPKNAENVYRQVVWVIGFPARGSLHLGFLALSLWRYYVVIIPETGEVLWAYDMK